MNTYPGLRSSHEKITRLAELIVAVDRRLAGSPTDVDQMLAAQSTHMCRVRIWSEIAYTRSRARTSAHPGVHALLHRQRIVAGVLARVETKHASDLARGMVLLRNGDPGECANYGSGGGVRIIDASGSRRRG